MHAEPLHLGKSGQSADRHMEDRKVLLGTVVGQWKMLLKSGDRRISIKICARSCFAKLCLIAWAFDTVPEFLIRLSASKRVSSSSPLPSGLVQDL